MLPGVGFFGSGTLAQILLDSLHEHGFKVVAIWSPNSDEAKRISQARSIPFYSSVIDKVVLLPNVQLIVTACPPHYHNQIASKACCVGKHVVCDWPPSQYIKDVRHMKDAASNYPSLITLFLTSLRYVPTFSILKQLIHEQQFLGHIRLINVTVLCDVIAINKDKSIVWDPNMGGGLLALYGTNVIDIISYITGYRAQRVHGIISTIKQLNYNELFKNNAEDFVNFQLELHPSESTNVHGKYLTLSKDQTIVANVILNGQHHNVQPTHELYVYGTKGYIVCRDGDIYAYRDPIHYSLPQKAQSNGHLETINKMVTNDNNNNINNSLIYDDITGLMLAPKETLIYSINERDYLKSTHISSITSSIKLSQNDHRLIYPQIYLIGIRNMITALKNAFIDSKNETQTRTYIDTNHNNEPVLGNEMVHWIKDPVNEAINFDDGIYLQAVIEAIRVSSELREWVRVHI